MQAIILAGGLGTRLRSVIADVPKPMAPIHGKPFLAWLLDYLKLQGITEIILSVHYLREHILDYFGLMYRDIPIRYVIENEALGTGGAIAYALKNLKTSAPVFIVNGDTFLKLDYRALLAQHQKNQPAITMALRKIPDCSRYGTVDVENNIVTVFREQGESCPGLINAGVYLLDPSLSVSFPKCEKFSFEKDFLFPSIKTLMPEAFLADDYFIDIGVPEDYARAVSDLKD